MPTIFLQKIVWLFLILVGSLPAAPFTAFGDGEKLVYRVGWGVFGGAGEITISAKAETSETGKPLMRLTVFTTSKGFIRGLYKLESTAEMLVERDTGLMLWVKETGMDRNKPINSRTDFDYQTRMAVHRDVQRPGRNRDFALNPGQEPVDLLSALIDTRNWNLKKGDARDVEVFAGREIYAVTVNATDTETVETRLGTFATLVLIPRMEKTPPRGVFERGGDIKVWLSQKDPKLPVKMALKLSLGQATLTLIQHTPPQPAAPAPASPGR